MPWWNRGIRAAVALGATLGASACGDDLAFPDHVVFGAAVAGFQVDMGCPTLPASECEDRASDWYQFITSTTARARASTFLTGGPPSSGPGFYELYEADLDRAKDLGLAGFRFSIEWSRVFPEPTFGVEGHDALRARASAAGLDYYRRLLAALKARGIQPLVTLHHYTLPSWIHDGAGCTNDFEHCTERGWLDPRTVPEIAKYAGFVARELGGGIDAWATLNEPMAVVLPGFLMPTVDRTNPPAQRLRYVEAKIAMLAMIEAHAAMVDAVRGNDTEDADGDGRATEIGIVYPVAPVLPKDPESAVDRLGAHNIGYIYNDVFMNAVIDGVLDDDLDGTGERQDRLADRCDFLGLNYYTKVVVEGEVDSFLPEFSPLLTFDPLSLEQGAVYPRGLREALVKIRDQWPRVPVIVTENGAHTATEGGQERFLIEHLQALLRAIHEDDVDVRGYYWWSLIDNYEWNQGMNLRFGLFSVDPGDPTKARGPREVAELYRQVVTNRAVSSDLAARFPLSE